MVQRRKSNNTKRRERRKLPQNISRCENFSHAKDCHAIGEIFISKIQHCVIARINCMPPSECVSCCCCRGECTFYTDQWFPIIYGSHTFSTRRLLPPENRPEIWISRKLWMKRFMLGRKSISPKRDMTGTCAWAPEQGKWKNFPPVIP